MLLIDPFELVYSIVVQRGLVFKDAHWSGPEKTHNRGSGAASAISVNTGIDALVELDIDQIFRTAPANAQLL